MRWAFVVLLFFAGAQVCWSQGAHSFAGSVREENTNLPLESVSLEVLSSGQRAASPVMSGFNGEFQFSPLRDGDYYIIATKKGYDSVTVQATIMAGSSPPLSIYLHKQDTKQPTGPGDVSTRELSIPERAREAFDEGHKLLYEKNAPAKSIVEFRHALEIFPTYYEAQTQIGVADYRLNKLNDAEKALRAAIEMSASKYADALYLLAEMLDDQERFVEAEPLARQALAINDSCWQCEFGLARALVGLKKSDEAETIAAKARDERPNSAQIYLVLANAHLQQRKYTLVVEDFGAYLKLEPNSPGSEGIRDRRNRLQSALKKTAPSSAQAKP